MHTQQPNKTHIKQPHTALGNTHLKVIAKSPASMESMFATPTKIETIFLNYRMKKQHIYPTSAKRQMYCKHILMHNPTHLYTCCISSPPYSHTKLASATPDTSKSLSRNTTRLTSQICTDWHMNSSGEELIHMYTTTNIYTSLNQNQLFVS